MYSKEDFPKKAIYRKPKNRIAFLTDFEDGEEIEFYRFASRPNSWKEGIAFYQSVTGKFKYNLVNIKDLEEIL